MIPCASLSAAESDLPRYAVLYFSGAGGTRLAAEALGSLLGGPRDSRVASIHDPDARGLALSASFLVFCYPTFFLKPAPAMLEFISSLPASPLPRPAFGLATYELYAENCNRVLGRALRAKGMVMTGSGALRSPGSDVSCLLPARLIPWLYRFEPRAAEKLAAAARRIQELERDRQAAPRIPWPAWYTPLSQLLQVALLNHFEKWTMRIRLSGERCTLCLRCVRDCHGKAWVLEEGALRHLPGRCDLCTRCIHHCPSKAIYMLEALKDNARLDGPRYDSLRADIGA